MHPRNTKVAQEKAKRPADLAVRRAAIARARRSKDSVAEADARREYAVAKLADFVERTVATAPPLTAEHIERIAALLRPELAKAGGLDGAA